MKNSKLWSFILVISIIAFSKLSMAQDNQASTQLRIPADNADKECWETILNHSGISSEAALSLYTIFFGSIYAEANEQQLVILEELKKEIFEALCSDKKVESNSNIVSIYPNPVHDKLILSGLPFGNYEAYVFDNSGNKEIQKSITINEQSENYILDTSGLRPAVYLIIISGNNFRKSFQFVK
jgi:hypothetical protein